jgi:hypothetical protein
MHETQRKGVNIALNSLSGELLHATWRCVAKWGTMIEITSGESVSRGGKLDMDIFSDNRSYCYVDMDQIIRDRLTTINR